MKTYEVQLAYDIITVEATTAREAVIKATAKTKNNVVVKIKRDHYLRQEGFEVYSYGSKNGIRSMVGVREVIETPAAEVVAEQVDGIRCGECGADVSDTEDGWCECMDKYEGRPSRGHCPTCGDELTHDSLCSCTLGVDMDSIGKPIASVADLRAYLA